MLVQSHGSFIFEKLEKKYDNAKATNDGEITTAYVRYLENEIRQQPDNWVWSHRRWKHIRKASN